MNKKNIGSLNWPDDLRRQAEEIIRGKSPQLSENLDTLLPQEQRQLLYELRVHQIELEMQNESLHRSQEELISSQLRYFNLYDLSPVGYFTLTREGLILETNITAGSLLGVTRNTLVKKSLTRFILREDQDIYYHHRKQLFETGTPQMCDLRLVKKDGSLFWARLESTIAHENKSEDALCYTLISDITELKQSEERIKHLNLVLRAIRNINQLIFKEKDRGRLIKGACNSLTETRGYYSSFIVLLDEKGKIETYAESGLGEDFLPMLKLLKKGELSTFGQIALKQEEVVIIEDPASACPDCPLVQVCSDRGSVMTVRLGRDKKIYGVMSVSIPAHFVTDKEEQALFMEAAGDIALGLHSIEMEKKLDKQTHDLQQSYQRTKRAMDATIETMSKIIEAKDPYTAGHQRRVSQLATAIAKELHLSQDKVEGIRIASLIHDIGKIGLPTEILSKPNKLSELEFSLIKEHPQIGYDILKSIDFSYPVAEIVLQHHERLNGSGYPQGLKSENILLEAKIIGVADVVEAMSSHRPYRPALGIDKALEEISQNSGILYDQEVVDACIKLFKKKGFKLK